MAATAPGSRPVDPAEAPNDAPEAGLGKDAGVALDERAQEELEEFGLRDSRRLKLPRRDRLAEDIRRLTDPKVCVSVRSGREVDDAGNVDRLELRAAEEILDDDGLEGPGAGRWSPLQAAVPEVRFSAAGMSR